MRELSPRDRGRLLRRWERIQSAADEARLEAAAEVRRLQAAGYSLTDVGRALGVTKQAVSDLLRRTESLTDRDTSATT